MDAARRIAALTHGDGAAWEGTAILHELVRVALDGGDPLAAVPAPSPRSTPPTARAGPTVLAPDWHPDEATEFNGAVWPCLGSAVWALRTTRLFESRLGGGDRPGR